MRRLWFINLQLVFLSLIAFVYILYLWKNLIIPFILSLLVASLIISLSDFFKKFKYIKAISVPLALSVLWAVWYIITSLIRNNLTEVVNKLPIYQRQFIEIITSYAEKFNVEDKLNIQNILTNVDFSTLINNAFSNVMAVFSSIWMVLFFAVFIILESKHFPDKMKKMFDTKVKYNKTLEIIKQIQWDIKSYFVIKAIISFCTALLSYIFMKIIGLDFAEFWALLIFMLNFIPNIWSILAVFFPIMLSVVQFEWIFMFFLTVSVLIWIQFLMGNLIEPRYLWNRLNLSPLVILLSLAFWWAIWWIIWMLLSVPIIVVINIILSKFKSTRPIAILMSEKWQIK